MKTIVNRYKELEKNKLDVREAYPVWKKNLDVAKQAGKEYPNFFEWLRGLVFVPEHLIDKDKWDEASKQKGKYLVCVSGGKVYDVNFIDLLGKGKVVKNNKRGNGRNEKDYIKRA